MRNTRIVEWGPVQGFRFSIEVSVRFAETDAQGIAHNASYLVWFEVARVEHLRRFGRGYVGMQEEGYEAVTTETHVRYLAPAVFDERLTVHVRCHDIRGARFRFDYAVVNAAGAVVADGWTAHAIVDRETYRPTRFPVWLRDAIVSAES
jgi:acyl-CoA thioester hydrolase